MKKRLVVIITAMAMSLSLAACGGKAEPAATTAAATTAAVTTAAATTAAPTTAAVATTAAETAAAEEEELVYTIDYDAVASWVDSGFIGTDESGAPVVMAIDAANENAIIIFGDNSDMTAVSFVGAITYTETTATITDEVNESTLTFGVNQIAEDTIELDMGDIGLATIKAADKAELLETIKNAIDNYTHVG